MVNLQTPSLYNWDSSTKCFSTIEDNLVLDFKDMKYCTFKTGSGCTFMTGPDCTFKTGSECVVIRRDVYEIIVLKEAEAIKLNTYGSSSYYSICR